MEYGVARTYNEVSIIIIIIIIICARLCGHFYFDNLAR
jgi:hypothetical protein